MVFEDAGKLNTLAGIILQISQLDLKQTDYQSPVDILFSASNRIERNSVVEDEYDELFLSALVIKTEATRETALYEFIEAVKELTFISAVLNDADREFFVLFMQKIPDR